MDVNENQERPEDVDALDAYVEALLAGRKPSLPGLGSDQADMLLQATQLATSNRAETVPNAAFVEQLHERLVGDRRRAWLNWPLSRRGLFGGLAGAAAAISVALFGEQVVQRLQPSVPANWVRVARAAELPPGTVKRFIARDTEGHILNMGGSIWALSAICTHMACVLDWQPAQQDFLCPCHGAAFTPEGQQLGAPDYGVGLPSLQRIPVQQQNGNLYVVLNPTA